MFVFKQEIDANAELVCIHDSARPLVDTEDVEKVCNNWQRLGEREIKQNFSKSD